MSDENRYVSNSYLENFEENEENRNMIEKKINEYVRELNSDLSYHRNSSIYCGIGGILYMNMILYENSKDNKYLLYCKDIIRYMDNYKERKNSITFLEGCTGIYSLCSMIYYYLGNEKHIEYLNMLINHLIKYKDELLKVNSECELLYGKCGYIYSFLFCKNIWMQYKEKKYIILKYLYYIMNSIFDYGIEKGRHFYDLTSLSLYYEWHEKIYLGAAHGYAGIFFVLFKLIHFFKNHIDDLCVSLEMENKSAKSDQKESNKKKNNNNDDGDGDDVYGDNNLKNKVMNKLDEYIHLIYKVTDEILTLYSTDNFNIYSSVKIDNMSSEQKTKKKKKEILLQWCHGNIGYIILLIKLLEYDNIPTYFKTKYNKEYINNMGLLIWRKGLLKKGLGLCHGISGNGIIFLYLYNYTQNKIWYLRAYKYALFSIKYFHKFCNIPDRPLSLFEGYAALVVFLSFILKPELVHFPAHDFSNMVMQKI
ncbi:G-protein coupled receptor, putative [Plasmodium sp. gorilla clade G2]|uniref:G-protein coupled receptor, putative n=1 Tax=Plasmodium sp. gorilla clade G2 TaxID=880535 RepID=UPI000D22A535|nr:G-protein coupled receptor, putative [Plasmodium sp. gorilla clade G2]SOV11878.1 G-protein coupled receptor, putative [Plasmodium sp. gorilla clade G2]